MSEAFTVVKRVLLTSFTIARLQHYAPTGRAAYSERVLLTSFTIARLQHYAPTGRAAYSKKFPTIICDMFSKYKARGPHGALWGSLRGPGQILELIRGRSQK